MCLLEKTAICILWRVGLGLGGRGGGGGGEKDSFRKVQILNVPWCQTAPVGGKGLLTSFTRLWIPSSIYISTSAWS